MPRRDQQRWEKQHASALTDEDKENYLPSDGEEEEEKTSAAAAAASSSSSSSSARASKSPWTCSSCTYLNLHPTASMCAMCSKARAGWVPAVKTTPKMIRSASAASSPAAAAAASADSLFSSANPGDELLSGISSLVSQYVQRTKTNAAIPTARISQLELALATEQSRVQMAHERSRVLEKRVAELEAQLAAAGGSKEEMQQRLVTVKQEKFEAQETATLVTQQKRKAEAELQSEADKRQRAEAEAAASQSSLAAAAAQVETLQAANEQLESEKPVCCACLSAPPAILLVNCSHTILCSSCNADLVKRRDLACPKCRVTVPAKKRLPVSL